MLYPLFFLDSIIYVLAAQAATRGVLKKKMFWKISQNSQENNACVRVSFLILVVFLWVLRKF